MADQLFPALLKYWRGRGGQSQLDCSLIAGVSPRHLSFLETGRARPSEGMVMRLMAALQVPPLEQNQALRAAGFAPRFPEPCLDELPSAVGAAVERMLRQQEPYPLLVLSFYGDVLRVNEAGKRVLGAFVAEPDRLTSPPNMFALVFDPALSRPFVRDWAQLARRMLSGLQRQVLQSPGDARLVEVLDGLFQHPDVPPEWRQPDFSADLGGTLTVGLQRGDMRLDFLTTITAFSAPGMVALQDLRIESYFPADEATRAACEQIAR